jgi:hypothetical protein
MDDFYLHADKYYLGFETTGITVRAEAVTAVIFRMGRRVLLQQFTDISEKRDTSTYRVKE